LSEGTGYNLKNASDGEKASKIPKWPSLRPRALKSKFRIFGKFRVFVWEMLLESKAMLSDNFFHTNLLSLLKIQIVIILIL